jgi:site-specific recombinase XerD
MKNLHPEQFMHLSPFTSPQYKTNKCTIEMALDAFLEPLAKNSRQTVLHCLRKAADDLGYEDTKLELVPWDRIGAGDLHQLVRCWRGTASSASIRVYIYAVRGVVESCVKLDLVDNNQFEPMRLIRVPKPPCRNGLGRYISEKERRQILQSCDSDERQVLGKRDKAMLGILFGSGARRAEATRLQIQDLNLTEATFTVAVNSNRLVEKYLAAWAIPPLRSWIAELKNRGITSGNILRRVSKGGKPLSNLSPNGLWRALGQRCLYAGVPAVKPYDARQTLGADLINENGLMVAKLALGHSDVTTTTTYNMIDRKDMQKIFNHKTI